MEISLGAAAFWLALAAVLISGGWFKARSEALKHETLRRLVEKTGQVDEAQLRLLFTPPPPPPMACQPPPAPGEGYRALRIVGVIVASLGIGGGLMFWLLDTIEVLPDALIGVAISSGVVVLGIGFFVSSRFAERPAQARDSSGRSAP